MSELSPRTWAERLFGNPSRTRRRSGRRPRTARLPGLEPLEGRALLATVTVSVVDFAFNPSPVSIHMGDTIHWVWGGDMHSSTSVAGSAESWNSGVHDTGFTFDHTFTHAGTFSYYCSIHGHDNGNGTAGGMSGVITVTGAATLQSIAVTTATPSIFAGGVAQFTAVGTFSDSTTQNLTSQVVWASANPAVATINAAGMASGLAKGTSTITAMMSGVMGSASLTVNAARPPSTDFVIGTDDQVYTRALDGSGNPTGPFALVAFGRVKDLAAVRFGGATSFEAFVIGTDDQVYAETVVGGVKRGYFATAFGSVASVSAGTDAAGNPLLFSIGTDHQLYEQKFDANGNAASPSYTRAAFGDFKLTVLTHDAGGNPLLYAVGQDGQVYGLRMGPTGAPVGGLFKMAPGGVKQMAVGADAAGEPEVFVVGLDNFVYALKADAAGGPVGGYFGVGGPVNSISVGSDAVGRPLLFAVGSDSQVYGHKFDANGTPTGPFFVAAGGPTTAASAGVGAGGNPELFAVLARDNQVYVAPFDANGNATGVFTLPAAGAVKKVVVA